MWQEPGSGHRLIKSVATRRLQRPDNASRRLTPSVRGQAFRQRGIDQTRMVIMATIVCGPAGLYLGGGFDDRADIPVTNPGVNATLAQISVWHDNQINGIQSSWLSPLQELITGRVHGGEVGFRLSIAIPPLVRLTGLSGCYGRSTERGFFSIRRLVFTFDNGAEFVAGQNPPMSWPFDFTIDDQAAKIFAFFGKASFGTPSVDALGVIMEV